MTFNCFNRAIRVIRKYQAEVGMDPIESTSKRGCMVAIWCVCNGTGMIAVGGLTRLMNLLFNGGLDTFDGCCPTDWR